MAAGRTFSLIEAAGILGVSRQTLTKWLHDGCPAVSRADRDRGIDWAISVAQVMDWRIDRAVESTMAKFEAKDSAKITTEEAKRRKAVAEAIIAEIEAAEALGEVVRVDDVLDAVTPEYAELRSQLMNFVAKIAGRAATMTNAAEIRAMGEAEMRKALDVLLYDQKAA